MSEKMPVKLLFAAAVLCVGLAAPSQAFADRDDHRGGIQSQINRHDGHGGNNRGWDHNDRNHGNWNNNGNHWQQRPRVVYVPPRPTTYYYYPQQAYGYAQPVYYNTPNYYVGRRLVGYQPVPPLYVRRLQPCPQGYYYSYHDNNVFMVRQHDNVIEQVISMLLR